MGSKIGQESGILLLVVMDSAKMERVVATGIEAGMEKMAIMPEISRCSGSIAAVSVAHYGILVANAHLRCSECTRIDVQST